MNGAKEKEIFRKAFLEGSAKGEKGLIKVLSKKYNPDYIKENLSTTSQAEGHTVFVIYNKEERYRQEVGYSCPEAPKDIIFPFDPYTAHMFIEVGMGGRSDQVPAPAFECKFCTYRQKEPYISPKQIEKMKDKLNERIKERQEQGLEV